ncbi:MAG: DinB family protein [FCB group bacterium]|nr:DinB family protein [FCB group bacterium]
MSTLLWINRTFEFSLPAEMFPMVVERLRGTPARLEEIVRSASPEILTQRHDNHWSIAETVGHLGDVEILWDLRMDDFLAGKKELFAADMSNRHTKEADHNSAPIEELLGRFRNARMALVARLDALEEHQIEITALHPRLKKPMRIIDSSFFAAEHDDHHLAALTGLIRGPA